MKNRELVEQVLMMAGVETPVEKQGNGITYHKDRCGYVLGGQGELYTEKLAKGWASSRRSGKTSSYFLNSAKKWYTPPRRIVDCSGMLVQAFRSEDPNFADRTANGFKSQFEKRGYIRDIPETAGLAVWKSGHIGIYLGNGKVCESRGVAHGVVISDISTQKWTYYGKLRCVVYDDAYVVYKKEEKPESYIIYKVKKGDSLWAISRKYKTTVRELAELNNLKKPSLIFVNQKIKIRKEEK